MAACGRRILGAGFVPRGAPGPFLRAILHGFVRFRGVVEVRGLATWSSWVHIGIYPLTLILLRRSAVLGMNHLFILDLVICIDVHAH